MKKHWKYFSYVIRHKWWVLVAGLQTRAPLWRLLIHDWTKFLPCEWFAYVNFFYGHHPEWRSISSGLKFAGYPPDLTSDYWKPRFEMAWNHHQKANKHHWQYWLLTNDNDDPKQMALKMPHHYVREMVADWMGAGRAITGKWECAQWYDKNRANIILNYDTRMLVELLLNIPGALDCKL